MNNPTLSGAAESAAPAAAVPTSITPTPGVQATPAAPTPDLQLARSGDGNSPTVVSAKPVLPLATLPKTIGLQPRQRLALQALAAGNTTEDAVRLAEVNPCTVHRWRKHDPAFIAAWNAWQAQTARAARGLLNAAHEHAARTILRAAQNGDVRASLAVLKGLGTLTPEKIGPEIAREVKQKLRSEAEDTKGRMGADTYERRRDRARRKLKEKQAADAAATAGEFRQWIKEYEKVPPLPRPITSEAIEQSVKASTAITLRSDACSIIIDAHAAKDLAALIKLIGQYDHGNPEQIEKLLSSRILLRCLLVADRVEEVAGKFEALGAKVEIRPAWKE